VDPEVLEDQAGRVVPADREVPEDLGDQGAQEVLVALEDLEVPRQRQNQENPQSLQKPRGNPVAPEVQVAQEVQAAQGDLVDQQPKGQVWLHQKFYRNLIISSI